MPLYFGCFLHFMVAILILQIQRSSWRGLNHGAPYVST
jgi:hypothetical protein